MPEDAAIDLHAADPDYVSRIQASFARQGIMTHLGASLTGIGPGTCEITLAYGDHLSQQHGFFHGGVVATIADSAAGYAGLTLMPKESGVLTVEFKINLVAPADGETLVARGRILRPGRTLTVSQAEVAVVKAGRERVCAVMQQTLMAILGREGIVG